MCDTTHWYVWPILCVLDQTCNSSSAASSVWHDSLLCVTWLIDICDMTHWYGCNVLCTLDQTRDGSSEVSSVKHDPSLICVTWLMDVCDMTHWHMWHDSLIWVTYFVYFRSDAQRSFWSLLRETWIIIDVCDMTHWNVGHVFMYFRSDVWA